MDGLLDAVTAMEATPSVNVGVLLENVISWQEVQFSAQWVMMGCLLGVVVALLVGGWWK